MCINCNNQISQAISICKLAKNHTKQLIPTSKVLDIFVAIIFSNKLIKNSLWQKINYLSKNVFTLIHVSLFFMTNIIISNRHHAKNLAKCELSRISKNVY